MKIKLEKPITLKETLLKKKTLAAEQKLEKKPRAKKKIPETSSITQQDSLTEQEIRLIGQDKKQERNISKQSAGRSRTKLTLQPKVAISTPIDEREDTHHIYESRPFVPENIPVGEDFTENLDTMDLKQLIGKDATSYEEITNSLDSLEEEGVITRIVEDSYETYDPEFVFEDPYDKYEEENAARDSEFQNITGKYYRQMPRTDGKFNKTQYKEAQRLATKFLEEKESEQLRKEAGSDHLDDYQDKILKQERADTLEDPQQHIDTDWVNNIKPSKESPEGIFRKQWEDNPSIKLRRTNEHTDGSQDFMRVYKDGTADYMPANPFIGATFKGDRLSKAEKKAQEKPWLSRLKNIFTINPKKIKNFLDDVKSEADSLSEQLGWDEEKELEKQRLQYEENLKNKELHYNQLAKDWKEDIDHTTKGIEKFEESTNHDKRLAA